MTNLEKVLSEIKKREDYVSLDSIKFHEKHANVYYNTTNNSCRLIVFEYCNSSNWGQEYVEKIKLTKFEHDLLYAQKKAYQYGSREIPATCDISELHAMGYFKDIKPGMTYDYVLENCEVIDG